ncbi:Metabotropic GABA-B receptor subtype 2, isoform C [Cichlidogyrus casuarinus]|uniref:Metabotropic GABA-B receptor subtype 2, isoform C n=1 Tax=Cichlidogyrus casuarinus TaxID=1844966 RepID=A0ABD2PV69_9PLAT
MFSKTWRVHSIFTNITINKRVIKDYQLMGMVSLLLFVDAIILITWRIVDPLELKVEDSKLSTSQTESSVPVQQKLLIKEHCKSERQSIWLGIIYLYKGILLVS